MEAAAATLKRKVEALESDTRATSTKPTAMAHGIAGDIRSTGTPARLTTHRQTRYDAARTAVLASPCPCCLMYSTVCHTQRPQR